MLLQKPNSFVFNKSGSKVLVNSAICNIMNMHSFSFVNTLLYDIIITAKKKMKIIHASMVNVNLTVIAVCLIFFSFYIKLCIFINS